MFAGTAGLGVYRSPDQGLTWENANGGALNFSTIYAMCYVNNRLIVEADNYLFNTKDAGDTWFVDQGSTVSAWTNTGSGFSQLLSASDSAFSGGKSAVEGSGNITRLKNFKVGSL